MAVIRAHKQVPPKKGGAPNTWLSLPAIIRIGAAAVVGLICGIAVGIFISWIYAPLVFWDVTALVALAAFWLSVRHLDADQTETHARTDDPGRGVADVIMICASIVSLGAVLVLIVMSSKATGYQKIAEVGLGLLSIVISWVSVHIIFMIRYADLYFKENGSIDFNSNEPPTYRDFAYVSFTIGMTYQVSDTNFKSNAMRRVALSHAILSYVFGTAIIATTINFLAGLAK